MRLLAILLSGIFLSATAQAAACSGTVAELRNKKADSELRSKWGICLLSHELERGEVAQAALRIIRDPKEDLLLREDLIEAFANASLRRTVKVEGKLGPEITEEDKNAIGNVAGGNTNALMALTQAVKSMDEVVPTTRYESEFFRAMSEIALDETSHVLLRALAVDSLEKATKAVQQSGLYDERMVRLSNETVRNIALREEPVSFYSAASVAFQESADGRALASATQLSTGRKLSSDAEPQAPVKNP